MTCHNHLNLPFRIRLSNMFVVTQDLCPWSNIGLSMVLGITSLPYGVCFDLPAI